MHQQEACNGLDWTDQRLALQAVGVVQSLLGS